MIMFKLENDILKIAIKKAGAELCNISSQQHGTSFMWNANPDVWGSYAPNLFPIIGALKDNTYFFNHEAYTLPKHGFIRHNDALAVTEQTSTSITFKLAYDDNSLKIYPFLFEFYLTYTLIDNTINISHTIKNCGDTPLYFSVGGHPAFKCPVFEGENYDDYALVFEHEEQSKTHLINMENGLISSNTKPIFNHSNILPLTHDLFNEDALVFKDLKSRKVTLNSKTYGDILSVSYHDFDYLGIWAKPNGDFVCIEPWLGIADHEDTNQGFTTKEGIIALDARQTFKAAYTIEIHDKHV